VAHFKISRSDASTRQLVSYASSSASSTAELGSTYAPIVGLLALEKGEFEQEITVPFDPDSLSVLRQPTLSLNVSEIEDIGQQTFDLILQPAANDAGLVPVLSGLDLSFDSLTGVATINFRADINASRLKPTLADTYKLAVVRRASASGAAKDPENSTQFLVISEGARAKFDQDRLNNGQVELELQFNTISGDCNLQPAHDGAKAFLLNGLNPATTESESGVVYTSVTIDAIVTDPIPTGVQLNEAAIDYSADVGYQVDSDGNSQSSVYFEMSHVGASLELTDAGKRKSNRHLAYYAISASGALSPLTYDAKLKAGAQFFDTDGDGVADFVNLVITDGGYGDLDGKKDGKISDPSTAATTDLNVVFTKSTDYLIKAADSHSTAPASVVLKASVTNRSSAACQMGYVVLDPSETAADLATILADISSLRRHSNILFSTLESSDLTLAPGTSFDREFSTINGQQLCFFEVSDATLDQLTSTSDSRFRLLSAGSLSGLSRSVVYSSISGVQFNLNLVDGDLGLNAMVAQKQADTCVLDLTALRPDQTLIGTLFYARETANCVVMGFYRAIDSKGTVRDSATGELVKVSDGLARYRASALAASNLVDSITGLAVDNRQTFTRAISLAETTYLTPYAIVNGTEYFVFSSLNPDRLNHFASLGANLFGFEDTYGLGDNDKDDAVLGFSFSRIATSAPG
jgi:hypothetical protein